MNAETCIDCKHWRPTVEQDGTLYGECHGGPPLQIQPPAIGRLPRIAAWILTPESESCGGFEAPKPSHEDIIRGTDPHAGRENPRAADPIEDTLEKDPTDAEAPATPGLVGDPDEYIGLTNQALRGQSQNRKGKANGKA